MPKLKRTPSNETVKSNSASEIISEIEEENLKAEYNVERDIETDEEGHSPEMKMLCGYTDEDGVLHDTFVMREMEGADEETVTTKTFTNPSKKINKILSLCTVRIGTLEQSQMSKNAWEKIIRNLYVGDQDYMLTVLREISLGKEFKSQHECPECGTKIDTTYEIEDLEILEFKGETEIPFELQRGYTDKKGREYIRGYVTLPTGGDREVFLPMARNNPSKALTAMFTRLVHFDCGAPTTNDVIRHLVLKDREYLAQLITDNSFGINVTREIECPNCGAVFNGALSIVNFI